jgi:hypothetical protein
MDFVKIPKNKMNKYIDEYLYIHDLDNPEVIVDNIDEQYNLIYNPYNLDFYIEAVDMYLNNQVLKYHTPIISEPKINRNDLCSCGSGKKYKKCCLIEK